MAWLYFGELSRYQMHFISRLKVQSIEQYKPGCAQGNCNRSVSLSLSASALTVHCPVWRVKTEAKKYVWSWGDIASWDWTYWGQGHGNDNIIVCSCWLLFSEVTSFLIVEKVNVWSLQLHVTEQLLTLGNVLEILKLEILAETCDGGRVNWCQTLDMWE